MAKRQSARQKMINLMYLVFIAMMALNIASEVLDGFDLVNENLKKAIDNSITKNNQLYKELYESYEQNPSKTEISYIAAQSIKAKTDSLFDLIKDLKQDIALKTDGPDADVDNLEVRDNTSASAQVMIAPMGGSGQGYELKGEIDQYREFIVDLVETSKQSLVSSTLSTEPSERALRENKDWVVASFENMPSIAVLSYLTGLQSSIKTAEGEALTSLLKSIDFSDYRVNAMDAFIVPQSDIVIAGTPYRAQIGLAAVDTTQRPKIVINGQTLPDDLKGLYTASTSTPGTKVLNGHVETTLRDGSILKLPFKREYTVIQPAATIAPLLMDVVYSGIPNPIRISVPGILDKDITATATGGRLEAKGNGQWTAHPGQVGADFVVSVSAKSGNRHIAVATQKFRIRPLPDPAAYIDYVDAKGVNKQFKRGAIPRNSLLNAPGIKAAIDDGILNIRFTVLSFKTYFVDVMGNSLPEVSAGSNFSPRQMEQIRKLSRGKSFFIGSIKVKGPDGVQREISPMEVRLN